MGKGTSYELCWNVTFCTYFYEFGRHGHHIDSRHAFADSVAFILQQRAPAIIGRQQDYANSLAIWLQQQQVGRVLLLCGLDSQYRRDRQIEGPQTRYLATDAAGGQHCESLGIHKLEDDVIANERELHGLLPPWPLIDALAERGIAYTMLTVFAAEGDNVPDGILLARVALQLLQQQQQEGATASDAQLSDIRTPCSWVALYGRPLNAVA